MVDRNPDNEWLDYATEQVAIAMATWLKRTVNTQRAIRDLKKAELIALAGAAVAQYDLEVGRRAQTQRPYPDPTTLLA